MTQLKLSVTGGNIKLNNCFEKHFLKRLNIVLLYDPAVPLLAESKVKYVHTKASTHIFTTGLLKNNPNVH